jgi:hypothetical protein
VDTLRLRRVCVWLDERVPDRGAFLHALEWASKLGLPLKLVTAAASGCEPEAAAEQLAAWAAACTRTGVPWDVALRQGPPGFEVGRFLHPAELTIVGADLPPVLENEILCRSSRLVSVPVLLCPRSWRPVSRVLVLHEHRDVGSRFLDIAAEVCRAFAVNPVVLSVGHSEREARLRRQLAEEAFAARGLAADFDLIAGCDAGTAAAAAARWRRCSHVFLEKRPISPWQRWLHGDTVRRLRALSAAFALLALPGRAEPVAAGTQPSPSTAARQLQPNEQDQNVSPR